MEGYIAEIRLFAGNFAPRGWAFCWGQVLSIAQNTALFSLLGTTFGGNGQTTFALPDLRGRVALGTGQAPGLTNRNLGEQGGVETVTLVVNQMPAHNHTARGTNNAANRPNAAGNLWATSPTGGSLYGANVSADATLNSQAIGTAGGSQPHENMPPFLGMNYIICVFGIFPSRD